MPAGPIALVTHSGSVFSAMLRTHRRLDYSRRRLVRPGAGHHRRRLPGLRAVAARRPGSSGWSSRPCATPPACARASPTPPTRDIPVVALDRRQPRPRGRALVDAHSGALAGSDAGWEALFAAYGVHRVDDLGELADSLECSPSAGGYAAGARRHRHRARLRGGAGAGRRRGRAARRAVRAAVASHDRPAQRPARPGPRADQPARRLGHRHRHRGSVRRLPDRARRRRRRRRRGARRRPGARVRRRRVVPQGARTGWSSTPTSRSSCCPTSRPRIDQPLAADLRAPASPCSRAPGPASARSATCSTRRHRRGRHVARSTRSGGPAGARFEAGEVDPLGLLADYGIPVVPTSNGRRARARPPRRRTPLGYPVVLKTADPDIHHKLDVDGVRLGLADARRRRGGVRRPRVAGSGRPSPCSPR